MKHIIITGTIEHPTKRQYERNGATNTYLSCSIKNTEGGRTTYLNASIFDIRLLKELGNELLSTKDYWAVEGELSSFKRQDETWGLSINVKKITKINVAIPNPTEPVITGTDDDIIWD